MANTSNCLVIEDSLVGVKSGKAAGMKVVVVPSETEADAAALADLSLNSLLEFQPELWGLPPFDDWVDNALPVDPIYLDGQLVDGFVAEFQEKDGEINVLPHQVCGIYFGWAKIGISKDIKVIVRIKREVSSSSQGNIVRFQPRPKEVSLLNSLRLCSIDESTDHLNGKQMHLVLVGYIRGFNFKGNLSSNSEICEDDKSVALSALRIQLISCVKTQSNYCYPIPVVIVGNLVLYVGIVFSLAYRIPQSIVTYTFD